MFDLTLGFALSGFICGFMGYGGLLGVSGNLSAKGLFFFFLGLALLTACMSAIAWLSRHGIPALARTWRATAQRLHERDFANPLWH